MCEQEQGSASFPVQTLTDWIQLLSTFSQTVKLVKRKKLFPSMAGRWSSEKWVLFTQLAQTLQQSRSISLLCFHVVPVNVFLSEVSSLWPMGRMRPRMAMNVAQHKLVNLLNAFFSSSVLVSVCVFNVWPKTTLLLPALPRDSKGLDALLSPCRSSTSNPFWSALPDSNGLLLR